VIPVLLHCNDSLVKTRNFEDPTYIGDPINAIRIFNEKEVDELVLIDIDVGKRGLGPNLRLIEEVAAECLMPLAYGGGIRSVEDAYHVIGLGVEKVVLHSAALLDIEIVHECSQTLGSQAVTLALDVAVDDAGKPVLLDATRRCLLPQRFWLEHVRAAVDAGVGEVLFTCVHKEGTMDGPDLALIQELSAAIKVPLIAHGGVGSVGDIVEAIQSGADAVAVGSFVVFRNKTSSVLISYPDLADIAKRLGGGTSDIR